MSSFLERLRRHENDRGMMADLRCVLIESKRHRAWPSLSRLGIPIDDDVLPFVAGLFATHPEIATEGNFGNTCKAIEQKRDQKSTDEKLTATERRFQYLLAAEKNEIQDRVQRMVLMAKSQGIPVNYEKLALDLRYWNERTKREWASAFWNQNQPSSDKGGS